MRNEKPVVLYDAPDSAVKVRVTAYRAKDGTTWLREEDARYQSCTHRKCSGCDALVSKSWAICDACRDRKRVEEYAAMPRAKWDGEAMLYSQPRDRYFSDPSEARDCLRDGETLADLRLVICTPNYARTLDEDDFADELPEDNAAPDELTDAIDAFNTTMKEAPPLSWSPSDHALDVDADEAPAGA